MKKYKQDWLSHGINFFGIFVSVLLGFLVANYTDNERDTKQIENLLSDFLVGSSTVIDKVKGTELYFRESREAAISTLENWETSEPNEFVFQLYKASQIVTPPHELNFYSFAFQTDGLAKIRNTTARQQAAKFFSYDTDIFKLESLVSHYRANVRSILPIDYQASFMVHCVDIEDRVLGMQHAKDCLEELPSVSIELADRLRKDLTLRRDLRSYVSQLLIIEQSLRDYRCNIILFADSISESSKQTNIPPTCVT